MTTDDSPHFKTRMDAPRDTPSCSIAFPSIPLWGCQQNSTGGEPAIGGSPLDLPIRVFFIGRRVLLSFALSNSLNHLIHYG